MDNLLNFQPKPRTDFRALARQLLRQHRAKKEAEGKMRQQDIDGRAADWYEGSETTNGRMAKLLEGK